MNEKRLKKFRLTSALVTFGVVALMGEFWLGVCAGTIIFLTGRLAALEPVLPGSWFENNKPKAWCGEYLPVGIMVLLASMIFIIIRGFFGTTAAIIIWAFAAFDFFRETPLMYRLFKDQDEKPAVSNSIIVEQPDAEPEEEPKKEESEEEPEKEEPKPEPEKEEPKPEPEKEEPKPEPEKEEPKTALVIDDTPDVPEVEDNPKGYPKKKGKRN